MRFVPCDSETRAFATGDMAPPLVTFQWDEGRGPEYLTRRRGALGKIRQLLTDPTVTLVLHNAAFDAAVWCANGLTAEVFEAYDRGRIMCTWVQERLGEIAGLSTRKRLDLATTCKAHGIKPPFEAKGTDEADELATSFGQFLDADEIPEPHLSYMLGDCIVGKLWERQRRRYGDDVPLKAVQMFSEMMFNLQLMSVWGLQTSEHAVAALRERAEAKLAELRPMAQEWGFIRPNGTRNMKALKAAVEAAYEASGRACPRTPKGSPMTAAMILEQSDNDRLEAFAHYGELLKLESTDLPLLERGVLHPRFELADTGRTITKKPAVQNMASKSGMRECIVPRPGMAFIDADYAGVELCSFAQVAIWELGDARTAELINRSGDPGYLHAVLGALLAGEPSPEAFMAKVRAGEPGYKDIRTRAKNGNFGFLGGMGAQRFMDYIWLGSKGKIRITLEESKAIRAATYQANPALPGYLKFVGSTEIGNSGMFESTCPITGMIRRGMWYSAAANCRFQRLAAMVMMRMLKRLARACYLGELRGGRPAAFIHDQVLVEVPEADAHEADAVVTRIMRDAAREVMPDVLTKVESQAAACYSKDSARVYDARGRLAVWRPAA